MFLYNKDTETHRGIFDTSTKNISALKICMVLKKMGIKNCMFPLYLSQPILAKYDPHNLTDPSEELRARIVYEMRTNYWYYARECVRVQSSGADPVRYVFNRANLALSWCFLNSIDSFLTMPRQKGKTVGVMTINGWSMFFSAINSRIGLIAKDSTLIAENVGRLKDIRNALPDFTVSYKNDTDNQEGLTYKELGNKFITYIGPADRKAAKSLARGQSFIYEDWDEFAYIRNNKDCYGAATSARNTAGRQAREHGIPVANLISTTAGMLSDPSGAFAFHIKSRAYRFNERVYDLEDKAALDEFLKYNSQNSMMYLEFSYKDLGETDQWLEEVTRDKSPVEIATDYLNEWQLGTGESIVPKELLERLSASVREPTHYSTHGPLTIRWYIDQNVLNDPEFKSKHFLIGLDTSDNVGRDFTTLVISDPDDLTVVATCRCNIANMVYVVTCVAELLTSLPNSILIAERNKNGAMLLDILIDMLLKKGDNPFYRIYNTFIQDYSSRTPQFSDIDLSDGTNRKHFGWTTSSSNDSRNILYGRVIINMLQHMADRLHDADLASEIKSLTIRDGRVDHPIGCHDDTCISWLLTGYFAFYGKNLYMYGIPQGEILKAVNNVGEHIDEGAKERQLKIRKRIGELKGLIETTNNMMLKASYTRELQHLEHYVDDKLIDHDIINVDQVKQQVQEERGRFDFSKKNLSLYF